MVLVEVLMVLLNVRHKRRNGYKPGFGTQARREIRTVLLTHFFNRQVSKRLCYDLVEALQRTFHIAFLKLAAQTVVRNAVGQRERPFDGFDHLGSADFSSRPAERITAMRSCMR